MSDTHRFDNSESCHYQLDLMEFAKDLTDLPLPPFVREFQGEYCYPENQPAVSTCTSTTVTTLAEVETPKKRGRKVKGRETTKTTKLRPNAAEKERERLKVFNGALETLQSVLPVRLPRGRKLQKKQTLQFAAQYIQFLRECVDGRQDYNDRHKFMWREGTAHGDAMEAIEAAAAKATSDRE